MSALANAVSASDTPWTLTSPLTVSSFPAEYTIDSEQVLITGGAHPRWSVTRGQNGSAKAAHAAGTALTAGWGGGGGGVTVDNGTDPPAAVTTLVAPGADVSTPGQATLIAARLLVSDLIDIAAIPAAAAVVIPAGSLLVKAFILRPDDSTNDGNPDLRLNIVIGPANNLVSRNTLITYDLTNAYAGTTGTGALLEDGGDTFASDPGMLVDSYARGALAQTDQALQVTKTSHLTGGHLRVYAIIATPAS